MTRLFQFPTAVQRLFILHSPFSVSQFVPPLKWFSFLICSDAVPSDVASLVIVIPQRIYIVSVYIYTYRYKHIYIQIHAIHIYHVSLGVCVCVHGCVLVCVCWFVCCGIYEYRQVMNEKRRFLTQGHSAGPSGTLRTTYIYIVLSKLSETNLIT